MNILIAFDIDGTLTDSTHKISNKYIKFFSQIYKKGIRISFITGRPESWALEILKDINVPFILSTHNGAKVSSLPNKEILIENCIPYKNIQEIEKINEQCFIYLENKIFFNSNQIKNALLEYVTKRSKEFHEILIPLDSLNFFKNHLVSSVKYFLKNENLAIDLMKKISSIDLSSYVIKDPFSSEHYIVQSTNLNATKGHVISFLKQKFSIDFVIAIGDDKNDIPMFHEANVSFVMNHATDEVKKHASFTITDIVSSVESYLMQKGIIWQNE